MTLQATDRIDMVSKPFPGDCCQLLLFIMDDGSVGDEIERYQLLTAKLSSYLEYLSGPEFHKKYPDVELQDVMIRIICRRPPNPAMTEIQAVAPRGEGGNPPLQVRVELFEEAEFRRRLEAGWEQ